MNEKLIEALKQAIEIHNEVFGTASNVTGSQFWRSEIIAIAGLITDSQTVQVTNNIIKKSKGDKDGV